MSKTSHKMKAFVRLKPLSQKESGFTVNSFISHSGKTISTDSSSKFNFDAVFSAQATQDQLFTSLAFQMIKDSVNGFNCALISYGARESGKTFTLVGPSYALYEKDSELHGLLPRFIKYLFDESKMTSLLNSTSVHIGLTLEAIEVDNDKTYDLLKQVNPLKKTLYAKVEMTNYQTAQSTLLTAFKNRNLKNRDISMIYSFTIDSVYKNKITDKLSAHQGKVLFADLANVNSKSVGCLNNIIHMMLKKYKYIDFSKSKLTSVLEPCLSGDYKTFFLSHVSQSVLEVSNSLAVISFCAKIRNLSTEVSQHENLRDALNLMIKENKKVNNDKEDIGKKETRQTKGNANSKNNSNSKSSEGPSENLRLIINNENIKQFLASKDKFDTYVNELINKKVEDEEKENNSRNERMQMFLKHRILEEIKEIRQCRELENAAIDAFNKLDFSLIENEITNISTQKNLEDINFIINNITNNNYNITSSENNTLYEKAETEKNLLLNEKNIEIFALKSYIQNIKSKTDDSIKPNKYISEKTLNNLISKILKESEGENKDIAISFFDDMIISLVEIKTKCEQMEQNIRENELKLAEKDEEIALINSELETSSSQLLIANERIKTFDDSIIVYNKSIIAFKAQVDKINTEVNFDEIYTLINSSNTKCEALAKLHENDLDQINNFISKTSKKMFDLPILKEGGSKRMSIIDIKNKEREINEKNKSIEDLKKSNSTLRTEVQKLRTENQKNKSQIQNLTAELKKALENLKKGESDIENLKEDNEKLKSANQNAKDQLNQAQNENESLKNDNQKYKDDVDNLNKEILQLQSEILLYKNKIDEINKELQKGKEDYGNLKEKYEKETEEFEKKIQEANETRERIISEKDAQINKIQSDLMEINKEKSEVEKKIVIIEENMKKTQEELEETLNEKLRIQTENENLNSSLNEMNLKLIKTQEEYTNAVEEKKREITKLESAIKDLEQQKNNIIKQKEENEKKHIEISNQLKESKEQLQKSKDESEASLKLNITKLIEEKNSFEKKNEEYENKEKLLNSKLETLEYKHSELISEKEKLEKEKYDKMQENTTLSNKVKEILLQLQKLQNEKEETERNLSSAKEKLKETEDQMKNLLKEKQNQIDEMNSKLEENEIKRKKLEEKKNETEENCKNLTLKINELLNQLSQLENEKKLLDKTKTEQIEQINKRIESMNKLIENLQVTLKNNEIAQAELEEKTEKYFKENQFIQSQRELLEKQLVEMREQMEVKEKVHQKEVANFTIQSKNLSNTIEKLKAQKAQLTRVKTQFEKKANELASKVNTLNEEKNKIESERKYLDKTVSSLLEELDTFKSTEFQGVVTQNDKFKEKIKSIFGKNLDIDNFLDDTKGVTINWDKSTLNSLTKKIIELREEKHAIQKDILLLRSDLNKTLSDSLAASQISLYVRIKEENRILKKEIAKMKKKNKKLEEGIKETYANYLPEMDNKTILNDVISVGEDIVSEKKLSKSRSVYQGGFNLQKKEIGLKNVNSRTESMNNDFKLNKSNTTNKNLVVNNNNMEKEYKLKEGNKNSKVVKFNLKATTSRSLSTKEK